MLGHVTICDTENVSRKYYHMPLYAPLTLTLHFILFVYFAYFSLSLNEYLTMATMMTMQTMEEKN